MGTASVAEYFMMKNPIDSRRLFLTALLATLLAFPAVSLAGEMESSTASYPGGGEGPLRVQFFVFMADIEDIDEATQTFNVNMYVRLWWQDKHLTQSGTSERILPLDSIWNPRIVVANQRGFIRKSLPETVRVSPDGTVTYDQHYVFKVIQRLKLSDFPMDRHRFRVQFVATGYTTNELVFVPGIVKSERELTGGGISSELSLPDWDIMEYESLVRPYEPIAGVKAAGFAFEFKAKRRFPFYFWQVILPLAVIVAMSWAAFWIDPSLVASQIGVATSSILSIIAYRFVLTNLLPRLPYMTRMDYFILGTTVMVFLALIEVILTSSLIYGNRGELARKIDRLSRLAFPVGFLVVFIWSFWG
jgi:Neurotransmitter-gated ion-channel ligand binding domain